MTLETDVHIYVCMETIFTGAKDVHLSFLGGRGNLTTTIKSKLAAKKKKKKSVLSHLNLANKTHKPDRFLKHGGVR